MIDPFFSITLLELSSAPSCTSLIATFGIDDKIIIHWKKYDYYVWDSTVEHWGGNFGSEDRYTLQLTGQIKE